MKPDLDAIMKSASAAPPEDEGHSADLEECAQDVMDALKTSDAKAFAAALKDFVSLAGAAPPDEGPSDDADAESPSGE